jgi:predicted AlkP superfamily phosphohydrolase/phosphomutase
MKGVYKNIDINQWLYENGYFQMKGTDFSLADRIIQKTKNFITKNKNIANFHHQVNWSRTKAYHMGSWGNIFINLKGRQPNGIVNPGTEYESLRDELIERFSRLEDPSNGRRVVNMVRKKEDLYAGEYLSQAPDLVVSWNDHYNCVKTAHELTEKNKNKKSVFQPVGIFSADHDPNGIFIIKSPSTLNGVRNLQADIVDIAATVLTIMGVAVPQSMDGKVLKDVFSDPVLAGNPVCVDNEKREVSLSEEIDYSEEDAEKVAERLRSLGYME